MNTYILQFGVSTPTVSIERELPAIEAMDLVLVLAPDLVKASERLKLWGRPISAPVATTAKGGRFGS